MVHAILAEAFVVFDIASSSDEFGALCSAAIIVESGHFADDFLADVWVSAT